MEEPYFCPDETYYGETVGKVKQEALNDLDGYKTSDGENFSFLSLKMIRHKMADKYQLDNGEILSEYQIESRKELMNEMRE